MRYSDSLLIAICLMLCTFLMVSIGTDMSATDALLSWGNNLPRLNAFIGQIGLILVVTHVLANTRAVARLVDAAASFAQTDVQAYVAVVLVAGLASLVSGALGVVIGGLVVLSIARQMHTKNRPVDFALLAASAYSGFVIWHMGLNGVAPLFMSSPDHEMMALTGRVIPTSETTFSWWNLSLAFAVLMGLVLLSVWVRPKGAAINTISTARLAQLEANLNAVDAEAATLSWQSWPTLTLGGVLLAYVFFKVVVNGGNFDFNAIIWSFMALGLILSGSMREYSRLATIAILTVAPILVQYPIYAGIMGLLSESGLGGSLSTWVASVSSKETLGLFAFLSAGVVNLFVPAAGGQWVIQGPIFLEAANTLNVDHSLIIMAIAYGDQWTNMIQPFWALPLLAIVGLNVGDVFSHLLKVFAVSGLIMGIGIFALSLT